MCFRDDHTDGQVTIKKNKKGYIGKGRETKKITQISHPAKLIPGNSDLTLYH